MWRYWSPFVPKNDCLSFEKKKKQTKILPTPIMTVCKGCGSSFKRSGLFAHLYHSKNPSCNAYLKQIQDDSKLFWSELDNSTENRDPFSKSDFNVDGDGDIFGDFADYSAADWGMHIDGSDHGPGSDGTEDNDSDTGGLPSTGILESEIRDNFDLEDEDLYMATMAEEELGMEPERSPYQSSPTPSSPMTITADTSGLHTTSTGKASRLRGGFEKDLENEPVIVQFRGRAGAVVEEATPSNNCYSAEIGTHDQNCYAPFNSELDWKFARWAKLQGPGSTSVTELMAIEGVCMIALSQLIHNY